MVLKYTDSKLCTKNFEFHNWPGPGEEAADLFSLSHAVIVPANSRRVIIGGQVGIQDNGSVPSSITEEIDTAFNHVERALRAAGLGDDAWEYVYKINTFEIPAQGLHEAISLAVGKYLKSNRPAWTGVQVAGLIMIQLHLEIEVEAFLP
ncbi:YjgF/Yer057p/UK114 family [Penicillium longicatenatum]|uniref:YjgF/Yer057p/UK114 family n=1 Tax=Penicillium longicatenatum TaxID=1561947 RepID=UPI002546FD0E|nr:YjgF/Yer057p/UK114 family [Penicillium longicatenatum]KAJ5661148.1 YjgF/Yer057p/UK114 family [Penicillium longicatenatum]